MKRSLHLIFAIALVSGCASNRYSVTYPQPKTPGAKNQVRALANAYVVVKRRKRIQNSMVGKAVKRILKSSWILGRTIFPVDSGKFAYELHRAMKRRGGFVAAYRATDQKAESDPYLGRVNPSGVLEVEFKTLDIAQKEVKKEIEVKNKKTGEVEKKSVVDWVVNGQIALHIRLLEYPGLRPLSSFPLRVSHKTTERLNKAGLKKPLHSWYRRNLPILMRKAAKKIPQKFAPVNFLHRSRQVYVDKRDERSKAAAKLARMGKWREASGLWAERLEEPRGQDPKQAWKDLMNLATAAEMLRIYHEAARIYQKARQASSENPGDPDAAKIKFDLIQSDLALATSAIGEGRLEEHDWFTAPLGILPFSDATTSIKGPEMLRQMVYETLKQGGYNVIDLEASDKQMRNHGFSMGGQLKKGYPKDFANWLGAKRLLFGDIVEFRNLMLGAVGKKIVAGELRLWDAPTGKDVWTGADAAVTETVARSGKEIGAMFVGQLVGRWVNVWRGKPLALESELFVRQNLETLPLRPAKR